MKKMKKLISILLTVMMVCGMCSVAFAAEGNAELNAIALQGINIVIGLVRVIAWGVALGMIIYIGIKYITKGAGAKAEVKDTLLPYLIGAVIIGAATEIVNALGISEGFSLTAFIVGLL